MTVEPANLVLRAIADEPDVPQRGSVSANWSKWLKQRLLGLLMVGLPLVLATAYWGLVAADQFVSEARFVVRSSSNTSSLSSLLGVSTTTRLSRTTDDTHAVNEFLRSRDAARRLVAEHGFLDIVAHPAADFIARHPRPWSRRSNETLFARYPDFIDVMFDGETGISTLQVRAFDPNDARRIAIALLTHAEELINRLNTRALQDTIAFSTDVVRKAEERLQSIQNRIAIFRNEEMVFDPALQSTATLELIAGLFAETAQLRASLSEIIATSPDSPRATAVRGRLKAIEQQIDEQRASIAGSEGSMAPKLARYEGLMLERELASKSFASALVSLETARQEAQRQQLYLERIVEPDVSDSPRYPKRLLAILAVLGFSTCCYWIVKVFGEAVMEHDA